MQVLKETVLYKCVKNQSHGLVTTKKTNAFLNKPDIGLNVD